MKGELAKRAVITGCSASATRSFLTMSAFAGKIEIRLHRAGAEHHVEAERADLRHVAGHDLVALLRHHRRLGARPLRAHAEIEEADTEGGGDFPQGGEIPVEFRLGRMRVGARGARKLELTAGLERDSAIGLVVKADDMALLDDRRPAEFALHAFEQGADTALRAAAGIRHRTQVRAIEGKLFMFGADAKFRRRSRAGLHSRQQADRAT